MYALNNGKLCTADEKVKELLNERDDYKNERDDYKKQAVAGYKLRTDLEFWRQMDAQEMRL
jgi:hypothetical protein